MHLVVRLNQSSDSHSGDLFEGDLHPAKTRGILEIATPELELPSGIPVRILASYVPGSDVGELSLKSAGVELARVAPLRPGLQLILRLASDELVVIWATG